MNIAVKLKGDTVALFFGCADEDQARQLAEDIVAQLKSGGIDLQLIDPTTIFPRDPNEVN